MSTTSATSTTSENYSATKEEEKYRKSGYELYALTSLIAGDLRAGAKARIVNSTTPIADNKLFDESVDEVYDAFGVDPNEEPSKNTQYKAQKIADGFYAKRRTP